MMGKGGRRREEQLVPDTRGGRRREGVGAAWRRRLDPYTEERKSEVFLGSPHDSAGLTQWDVQLERKIHSATAGNRRRGSP